MLMVITPLVISGFLLIYPLVLQQVSLIYLIFWLMTLLRRHMVAMSALILPVFPVMRLYRVVPLIPAMLTRTLTRVFLIIRPSRWNKGIPSLN